MRALSSILFIATISVSAFATEPRWCSVSSKDPSNTVRYAPIAVAGQVQGEARARIVYMPNDPVENVELLSGVPMLSQPLVDQLSKWIVRSNASGNELCQTLIIAKFKLRMPVGRGKEKVKFATAPNTIYIYISGPWPITYESVSNRASQQAF